MAPDDLAAWLRLALTTGVGNIVARRLLAAFGLPAQIFDQPATALGQIASASQVQALSEEPPALASLLDTTVEWPRAIAVVGSRNPTPQGLANARDFARHFSASGLTVVSGLALGIDAAAHEGALDAAAADQLATIAVVGTGLDRVYPKQNRAL